MKRFTFAALIALLFAALTATSAQAASPHYVKDPSVTVGDNSLVVSFKAAGLGNDDTIATFRLTGTVSATAQCFTKSGNPVNGVPKTDTTYVDEFPSFPVRNGQVTGLITISPLSTLECTGKQVAKITSVAYDLTLSNADLGTTNLSSP